MKIKFILLILLFFFICGCDKKYFKGTYKTPLIKYTTEEQTKKYQKIFATGSSVFIDRPYYGPHEGPGIATGVGPFLIIEWYSKNDKKELEVSFKRTISISSIINIDQLKNPSPYNTIIYYPGPLGDIEFAICDKEFGEKVINRWKSYLISQEPMN